MVYSTRQETGSDEEEVGFHGEESDHIYPINESGTTWDLVELDAPAASDPIWNATLRAHTLNNIDVVFQEILRRPSGQRVLEILEDCSSQRVSDVPWYAEATRRARITRNHHARRRACIQRERDIETRRQRGERPTWQEQLEEQQRNERQIQQEQLEERQPYIRDLTAMIDESFATDTDFLSLGNTLSIEGQGPSSRADPPPSTFEQGRSQHSEVLGPENREIAEDNTAAQEPERGFFLDDTRHYGSFTAILEYIRSRRSGPQTFRE